MDLLLQSNTVALILLIPGLISGALALYAFFNRPVTGSKTFTLLMLAVMVWSLAYGAELSSVQLDDMLFWIALEYLGISTVPVFWLILTLLYTGREKVVNARNVILLLIIPLLTIALVATNQYHHLHYSAVKMDASGPFPLLSLTMGTWYWINATYAYIVLFAGTILLLERVSSRNLLYRKQVISMLVGVSVPWIANILYQVANLKPFGHLDMTPFAFTVTGLALAWGMFRYRLFDIMPIAQEAVVDGMDDGMIVMDTKFRIANVNRAAQHILGTADLSAGVNLEESLVNWPDLLRVLRVGGNILLEIERRDAGVNKYYEVTKSDLFDRRSNLIGKSIVLRDITKRKFTEQIIRENEEKFRTFFLTTRDAVFMTTVDGRWLEINEAAAEIFGYENVEELRKIPVLDLYVDPAQRQEYMEMISSQGFVKDFPVVFRRRSGQRMDALLTAVPVKDKAGKATGFQGTIKDVTEIKQTQEALQQANEKLQQMLLSAEQRNREMTLLGEMTQSIQSSKSMDAAHLSAAEYLSKLFEGDSGCVLMVDSDSGMVEVQASFGTPIGKTAFSASDCFSLQQGKMLYESDGSDPSLICPHLGRFHGFFISIPLITPGGNSWMVHLQRAKEEGSTMLEGKQWLESRRPLLMLVAQELAVALSNIRLRETLHDQAIRDPLTGIYNRRYMEEMLDVQIRRSKRSGSSIGFIMADLDYFKKFNDTYGHEAGDLLLKAVANRIRGIIRVEDIACRYGGEEFLIILPSAGLQDTYARAVQMLKEIRDISFMYGDQKLGNITISMGVSAYPGNGDNASVLVRAADQAMYEAKQTGRDRVVLAE